MKKIIFLILISALIFPNIILADYPVIGGININNSDTTASQFITYLFYIITAIGSFLGVVLLIIAGLEWFGSYGDAKVINSAKRKIAAVFTGLAVLFTSYIIINTINPAIMNINIDDIGSDYEPIDIVIPEGKGIFLYSEVNYETEEDPLNIKISKASLISDSFYRKTSSIKINQPDNMTLGAILFADREDDEGKIDTGTEFRGKCSYITGSISNLDNALGDQNDPPIGQNTLASIIVFAGSAGGGITIYNNYNCEPKVDKYCREIDDHDDEWEEPNPCPLPEEYSCSFNINEFKSISELLEEDCQSEDGGFEGDILSIGVSKRTGILLRGRLIDGEDEAEESCQYIDSKNTTCINMIKYGPFYRVIDGKMDSFFSPKEIMVFSLD
jgi:hypothetical protein